MLLAVHGVRPRNDEVGAYGSCGPTLFALWNLSVGEEERGDPEEAARVREVMADLCEDHGRMRDAAHHRWMAARIRGLGSDNCLGGS